MSPSPNYELFNRNNSSIRFQSWNYRGCWHQTFPLIVTQEPLYPPSITIEKEIILLDSYSLSLPHCSNIG